MATSSLSFSRGVRFMVVPRCRSAVPYPRQRAREAGGLMADQAGNPDHSRAQSRCLGIEKPDDQEAVHQGDTGCVLRVPEQGAHWLKQFASVMRGVKHGSAGNRIAEPERRVTLCDDIAIEPQGVRPNQPTLAANAPGVMQESHAQFLAHGLSPQYDALHRQHARTWCEVCAKRTT